MPPQGPPYGWDVYQLQPGGAALEYLVTLTDAREMMWRVELDGTGSGSFAINKNSAQATAENLAQGNLVKVCVPEVSTTDYVFAFFIEQGDLTLVSPDEEGGEMLRFGGRGILSYLSYGVAWAGSFIPGGDPAPLDGLIRAYSAGTGSAPGQILMRLIDEFQDYDRPQQPIPYVTVDFDYTNDSDAAAWATTDATDEFTYKVGDFGADIVLALIEAADGALVVQMGPDFDLHAYNEYGRDLTATVRFEKGDNIVGELRRELAEDRVVTHMLVGGETDHYADAQLADAATRVTKEGFVPSFGIDATALEAVGDAELSKRQRKSERISLQVLSDRGTPP